CIPVSFFRSVLCKCCRWLIKNNLMSDEGFNKLPDLNEKFVIDDDILDVLKSDDEVWKNFNEFPDLYKRIKISNIQKERKKADIFSRMLNNFIENTKKGKMPGSWNDYGRLL
uniref:YdeI/OmpD-associated family protein n=1 Tax=Methanobrevibacter gottschalkii TaxID=190974 RepID=UPI0026EF3238